MGVIVYDIGKVTDWLIAIGTIGAVIVSLYFSYKRSKKKAKVFKRDFEGPFGEILIFRIVNVGIIPIDISTSTISIDKPVWIFWKKYESKTVGRSIFGNEREILEQSKSKEVTYKLFEINTNLNNQDIPFGKSIILVHNFRDTEGKSYKKNLNTK